MKKFLFIILFMAAGAMVTIAVQKAFQDEKSEFRSAMQPEVQTIPAKYSPELAVQGPDFTLAAEKTNPVVQIAFHVLGQPDRGVL